jgi:vacuolar-type H+-ATPase subunit D/Vma8
MSFTPISKLIKKYDKKQTVKLNNNNSIQMRKLLKCTKAYALFQKGYNTVQTSIDLQLDFNEVRKYWSEYLRLKNMTKLYNIYIESEYHLDYLFKIYYFLLRNKIDFENIENILRVASDSMKLYQTRSNLLEDIASLKQNKIDYNFRPLQPLRPLGSLPRYYNWNC